MAVTEAETKRVIPQDSWVYRYVNHAVKQTSAPLVYHLGVALTVLGATAPEDYQIQYAGPARATHFTMLVGESGTDMKSAALRVGRSLLQEAEPGLLGEYPGSWQGLVDSLADKPRQMIPIGEFGKFLASAKSGYMEAIKATLADLWDGDPIERRLAHGRSKIVEKPRLSIAAACSLNYLEAYTLTEDWQGGFMGRWLICYGRAERVAAWPESNRDDMDWLVSELRQRSLASSGRCIGRTRQAKLLWDDWFQTLRRRRLPDKLLAIKARAPTMAVKVALTYAWDFGDGPSGHDFRLTPRELEPAIGMAELHIRSLIDLSRHIADHPEARLRRRVLSTLKNLGGAATLGQVCQALQRTMRTIRPVLESLVEEGTVECEDTLVGKSTYMITTKMDD
jgi:hypothetical protein